MGFDNECILNIQSLAGEYFCPVCRTLVYPHEAIQTPCTHLYCKPCLSYVVSSTQACPYDGYLVTEAGSKPLMESNKALAETIGKTVVHCLYHRSGCVWQGSLSECTTHCSGCAFGNSPVVCNRCGIQIVHRQVQEHAQTCNVNGTSTQPHGSEAASNAATSGVVSTDQSKIANQAAAPPSAASQTQTSQTAVGPAAAQNLSQQATSYPVPQAMPAPEQQYYQQYQQYYQQYPGYDPYQQSYQQYFPYQQQPAQQVQQPPPQPQVQQQAQAPMPQVQPQGQPQPQPQTHPQTQSQIPVNGQSQPLYPQTAVVGSSQNQGQASSQPQGHPAGQPVAHGHVPLQSYSQVQPHLVQSHAQPSQYQQPVIQMHQPQLPQVQPYPQTQPQPQPYSQPHSHFHPQPQPPPQMQQINPQYPPASHPLYPSQPLQQIQHVPPQQHSMQAQPPSGSLPPQFPPPPSPHMRPPQGPQPPQMLPPQQRPVIHQVQQPMPPPYMQQTQAFPGQTPGQHQGQPHHAGPFSNQHLPVRSQVPPQPMQQSQQPSPGFVQPQQGNALPHGMTPQSYVGRPALNQGGQPPQYLHPSGSAGVAPLARPPPFGSSQPSVNQSNVNMSNQHNDYAPPSGGDQTFERRVDQQEDKSSSVKNSESVINDFGANFNEVKPETSMNDEFKREDGQRKDEALTQDAVSVLHQAQGIPGDSAATQIVKEECKDGALDSAHDMKFATIDSAKQGEKNVNFQGSSQIKNGPFSQPQTAPQGQIKGTEQPSHLASVTEQGRSAHPPVPYGLPGPQQRPMLQSASNTEPTVGKSPSHAKPIGHGYPPHVPHPSEQFQPPGGPISFANRGHEAQSAGHVRNSRMSQGDPLGPPLPRGPDGPPLLRHHGSMESDIYQNRRPPHFEGRGQDFHRPPYGAESNSIRMNGPPPPGFDPSSAPGFGDENFGTSDIFPMPPNRHREESYKQFSGPPHLGREDSPKFGPSRFHEKDRHGYGYDGGPRLPLYHLNESSGRPLPVSIHDNRGRFDKFDNNRQNPDFLGPMHGFGRHHMDRLPPTSPGNAFGGPINIDVDGRNMERQQFGERFPVGPPGHMHRREFDGPGKPLNGEPFGPRDLSARGEPGFGSFHDYNGPGGFSHQPRFGESFGTKSTRPYLDEPVFRNSYSRQGFPSDGGFYAGGPDSFDPLMKRKTFSMGWCRICKVDCESVEGLDMHGQTREHQRMSMDMVLSIKKKNVKRQKTSSEHEGASKFRSSEIYARAEKP